MSALEANFDGLIGPTHNYAGLSFGNKASAKNALMTSNPKEAALQGLAKMKALSDLGLMQGVLPPHARPHIPTLKSFGFSGSDKEIVAKASKADPALFRNVMAASAMWTANAATVAPSADTADHRVHFTAANLAAMFHRSIEHETTSRVLKAIFPEGKMFAHHPVLKGGVHMGDEGAANHNRFCREYGEAGIHLFVYGRKAFHKKTTRPEKFPGRQTLEASEAVARLHQLDPAKVLFAQQNPKAVDKGAFHNDVVAVANKDVFFYHEEAFEDPKGLKEALQKMAGFDIQFVEVPAEAVSLKQAVKSYLFNSQLISVPGRDGLTLILPMEAKEKKSTRTYLEGLVGKNEYHPIRHVEFLDVRQSMRNGGGPACLRLRVVLTEEEQKALGANVIMTGALYGALVAWVEKHYRDRLSPDDLADPALLEESFKALDELTKILKLGAVYEFQKA